MLSPALEALVYVVTGALLGLRLTVVGIGLFTFVLVLLRLSYGYFENDSLSALLISAALVMICLQIGYVLSIAFQAFLRRK